MAFSILSSLMMTLSVQPLPFPALGPSTKVWLDAFDPASRLHDFLPVGPQGAIPFPELPLETWRDDPSRRDRLTKAFESLGLPYSPTQSKAILELRNPKSVVVVTGQQPGALGGPLYTFSKILTAVVLSQKLREKWQIPVIPVLWDGGDDHDLGEMDEVAWPKGDDGIARFHFGIGDTGIRPAWMIQLTEKMHLAWEEFLDSAHPSTEYRGRFTDWYSSLWRESPSWCDLFDRFWLKIFEHHPLLIVRPWASPFRQMAGTLMAAEVENPQASMIAVADTTIELSKACYKPQVHKKMGLCNFLYIDGEGRRPVTYERDRFRIEGEDGLIACEDLHQECLEYPERFSPNALLRPVVQDAILPNAAVIVGPSEIAYHAQLKGLYQRHSVNRSWIVPRFSITIANSGQRKKMEELGLSWSDLKRDESEIAKNLASIGTEDQALEKLRTLDSQFHTAREVFIDLLRSGRQHLVEPAEAQMSRIEKILGQIQDLLLRDEAKRDATCLGRIRGLKTNLLPEGNLQERVYSLAWLVCRHGFDWIEPLLENTHSWDGESHYVITLGK